MKVFYSLYGQLLNKKLLYKSYLQVRKNKGAAGTDGQSLSDFASDADRYLNQLLSELQRKTYQPLPVRRVVIPKADGGERLLGIPAVRDRIVQQALKTLLEPIFDPDFHPSSYGYRPGRSAHDAINKATMFIRDYGRRHVVDMDLSKCFDRLDHDLILLSVRRKVADGSVLNLINQFLVSGVMDGDVLTYAESGSPQGGVISPLLANIYLDGFDQEMKRRGHRIVRYADDILILCCSGKGARNALNSATSILEGELRLLVNRSKTHIVHSDNGVKFLGVAIGSRYTRIQAPKLTQLMMTVRALTRRNTGLGVTSIVKRLSPILRGFVNYFSIANSHRDFKRLGGWIRRRLRAIQLRQWKRASRLHRRLKQLGYKPPFKSIRMNSWRNACSPLAHHAMPNKWFEEIGLLKL